ncbi:MAG TPA: alpha/beta hydrolase [Thermoanaerobaculia bacterium]|nr:alpha/beta hydrolase [Thermoanaerobaculia bacterium]
MERNRAACVLALCAAALLLTAVRCSTGSATTNSPEESLAEAPSHFATLDGWRIHYKSLGHGRQTLIFLHGWTCDLEFWRFQAPFFARHNRVLAIDLPGHGQSENPETPYTMNLFAKSVDAVMRHAGVDSAILVGHSMGTPVARQFYRLFPSKTLAIVCVDGSLRAITTDPAQVEKFLAPYRASDYKEALGKMADSMFSAATPAEMRVEMRQAMLATPQHVIVGAGESMFDPSIWKDDPIKVPVLVVLAKSPFWTDDYETYVRRICPYLDYRVLEGVGHFLMVDRPQEFNRILADFLWARGLTRRKAS